MFIESSIKYFLWSLSDFLNHTHWSANVHLNLDPTRCTCFWHICFVVAQYSAPHTTRSLIITIATLDSLLTSPLDLWAYWGSYLFNSGAVFWGVTFISRRTMNENIIPYKKNNMNLWTCSPKQTTLWCSRYTGTVCIHIVLRCAAGALYWVTRRVGFKTIVFMELYLSFLFGSWTCN